MKRTAFSPHDDIYVNYIKENKKYSPHVQHYHDEYEIYFQLHGRRYIFFDNMCYALERGDLVILKPFDIHYAESKESDYYERYVLNFREEVLKRILSGEEMSMLTNKLGSCVVHLNEEQSERACGYYEEMERLSKEKGFLAKKVLCAELVQFVVYIVNCKGSRIMDGKAIPSQFLTAIRYINDNYKNQLSIDMIAGAANMSKYHFCRKFKEITGATVLEYINNIRLIKVHSLLINTELGMEEIAHSTGFTSAIQMLRVFKAVYGVAPRDFRKNEKSNI